MSSNTQNAFPSEVAISKLSKIEFMARSLTENLEASTDENAWQYAQLAEKIQNEISALEQDILRYNYFFEVASNLYNNEQQKTPRQHPENNQEAQPKKSTGNPGVRRLTAV